MSSPTCPHCRKALPIPNKQWAWQPPWQCSHCGGLYGFGRHALFRIPSDLKPLTDLMDWGKAKYWCHYAANGVYCYAICYPNGFPFYVGKGRAQRMLAHAHYLAQDRPPLNEKEWVLQKIQQAGWQELYAVLALERSEEAALQAEAVAIGAWGRRRTGGMLTNDDPGQLQEQPEAWIIPDQPATKADGTLERAWWVLHPDVNRRRPSHKGVLISCPNCTGPCLHPGHICLDSARCPHCCHFFRVDGEFVNDYWHKNRPRVNHVTHLRADKPYAWKEPERPKWSIPRFWRKR